MKMVRMNGLHLESVPPLFRKFHAVIYEAAKSNIASLKFVDEFLFKNEKFTFKLIEFNPLALQFIPKSLPFTKQMIMKAVEKNGMALQFASDFFEFNYQMMHETLITKNFLIRNVPVFVMTAFCEICDLMISAVSNDGMTLEFVSTHLDKLEILVCESHCMRRHQCELFSWMRNRILKIFKTALEKDEKSKQFIPLRFWIEMD